MQFEISVTLAVQSIGSWLNPLMSLFSFLGTEQFYLVLVPFIYWCVDPAFGLSIGAMLMLTNVVNSAFKLALHSPRPYWLDPQVKALGAESSFGMPSGHSQNAAAIWGLAAAKIKRNWAWWAAAIIAFMIGFSRLYLGVHFLRDVLSGWLIGAVLLWLFLKLEGRLANWFRSAGLGVQLLTALTSAALMMAIGLIIQAINGGYIVPDQWMTMALAATGETIDPLSLDGFFTAAGVWFGLLSGVAILLHGPGLVSAEGTPGQKLLRYVLGAVVMSGLYAGLGAIFPRNADLLSFFLRFVRYTLIGLWVSAGAPWLFVKLNLSRPQKAVQK